LDAITEEILEALESLEDYPLLDEDLHSQLESESQNKAWESWVRTDFRKELGAAMFSLWHSSPKAVQRDIETRADYESRLDDTEEYLSSDCGEISDDNLASIFWQLADLANVYWVNEEGAGSDSTIDVEAVVSRGLLKPEPWSEYRKTAMAKLNAEIMAAMSERKYELGVARYIDPTQLNLALEADNV
jgi:hypothetical protein